MGEPRRFDLTMLDATYDAFRRDMARLEAAAGADGALTGVAVANTWCLFTSYWRVQDIAEKRALWTVMYATEAGAPGHVGAVLDAMAVRALRVVPLMDAVDAALERRDRPLFARYVRDLRGAVCALLDFKESDVLPLISSTLTPYEWGTFDVEFRRELGVRNLGVFLPWLLDDAPEPTRRAVLRLLPPPVRLVYRTSWRPRYRRRSRLAVPAC
ncbi:hypothetical protein BZB76_3722 [Actinomadura pelletieri DSM 43383]|uniref:Uncharacterized protein n=1 Tax=Actinomadura pelletieri DSM 43383 TaxID=1120940 RepID=A0A495QKG3_9ACTN|nr:hypothetical protein [Actinomadura pelletieri]RKS73039.1 hypothetical protein BZB76_3722 [Actinomadura pelletieri DSM 43383]